MKEFTPYLTFDGNCREAMTFYAKCLGAALHVVPFSDAPAGQFNFPQEAGDKVMHASLSRGPAVLMASDCPPGMPFKQGNNFTVCINCDSLEEIQSLFRAFESSGTVLMPLQDTFWGAHFGMLTDQFGVSWMFSFHRPNER